MTTGMLAVLTGVALAPAQDPAPDRSRHLLVVPDSAEATAALARTDARVVARYESFTLVEASGGEADRLSAAGAERRDDMRTVETAAGVIDPARRRSLAGKDAPDRDAVLALVQFVGPPKEAWIARLRETGARVVTYQAENAYVVHASGDAVDRLAALQGGEPYVRAVSVLTAADKLEERSSDTGVFAVSTVAGDAGSDARAELARAGAARLAPQTVGAVRTEYRSLSDAEVLALAADPGVVAVEAVGEAEPFDERAAQIVAGNLTPGFRPTGPGYLGWLVQPERIPAQTTFDFAIDVTDTGLAGGVDPPAHNDFRELGSAANPDRVSYLANYTSDADARDCAGHGTNVASIAMGHNTSTGAAVEDTAGFNHGLGVAPFARVGASKIFECDGDQSGSWTPASLSAAAYAAGARISNNSWGDRGISRWGDYSPRSAAYDAVVRDASTGVGGNQELLEVWSAGNDGEGNPNFTDEGYGTISPEGSAKNVITVGASESVRSSGTDGCGTTNSDADSARDIVGFSSRGPTDDGRLKPDIVAPGTHVTGAAPLHPDYTGFEMCNPFFSGTTLYSLGSGTSMAAPAVSGAAAVLREWYERTESAEPSPALLKAMLVSSAADLGGGQNGKGDTVAPGPNHDQGWGRVDLGRALDSTTRQYYDQLPGDMLDFSGDTVVRSFAVQDTSKPVKVTLVWTDAPGPTSGNPVVNNLDLQVSRPEGAYHGNMFAGAWSRTGGDTDPRNNVESVYLPPGTGGRLAVQVRATVLAGNGVPGNVDSTDQDFALVVSNAVEQPAPMLAHDATTLDDTLGDGDGAIESDETFELNERVRNAGDVAATGLSGFLSSASPSVTVTQAASSYPSLSPGAAGQNDTPFAAKLANAATCGVDVPATLEITSTAPAETHTIPLMLPTGAPGAPETALASGAQVGLVIPDDDAAGVSSTVFVPAVGRIRDLDVTIPGDSLNPGIDHPWVGDLRIDLIAPDGTTVVLVNHPGGPDNGGKDFGGTTFDDEASLNISQGTAPYTGSFRPQHDQLSRFDGKPRRGTWTLRVRDLFEGDVGTLEAWGVTTQRAVCDIDTQAPNTVVDSFPGSPTTQTSAHFTFSSPNDSTATFECRLDSTNPNDFAPCTAPHSYTNLPDGDHIFHVRALDGSGNVDPSPARHEWTVDTTPPESTIDSGPSGFTTSTDAELTFSTEANATLECSLDGEPFAACTSPVSLSGLAEETHTFAVQARDLAGNLEPVPATRTWTVDLTAPQPSVTSPSNGSLTQDRSPLLRGNAGTLPGDASSVLVNVYEGGNVTGQQVESHNASVSGAGEWSVEAGAGTPLEPGDYTVEVSQSDAAGNGPGRATSSFTITEDAQPPAVLVTAPPTGATFSDATPALSGIAGTAEGDEGEVTIEVFAGGFAAGLPAQTMIVPRDGATGAWSVELGALSEGTWTVRVTQLDSAANAGSAVITFVIDLPDPPPPPPPGEAPAFILAPAEQRLADVLAGRLTVTAACAQACEVTAALTITARADAGRRTTARATRVKRLSGAGTATVPVRLTRRARAAVRGARSARGTLAVTIKTTGDKLSLRRSLSLSRAAGLRGVAARGLRMWAACSEACPLAGSLTLSAKEARRIGLKPRGSARVQIGAGRANGAANAPVRLTMKIKRSAKNALRRARKVRATLETVAGPSGGSRRAAERSVTLRR